MLSRKRVGEDAFRMWRAVFAFALVDGVLSIEEQNILAHHIESHHFSDDQLRQLKQDMLTPKDVEEMFGQIERKENKQDFCALARTLVWCDGNIDLQEKKILQRVGCFQKREFSSLLKDSVKAKLYQEFMDLYERTGGFASVVRTPLLEMVA